MITCVDQLLQCTVVTGHRSPVHAHHMLPYTSTCSTTCVPFVHPVAWTCMPHLQWKSEPCGWENSGMAACMQAVASKSHERGVRKQDRGPSPRGPSGSRRVPSVVPVRVQARHTKGPRGECIQIHQRRRKITEKHTPTNPSSRAHPLAVLCSTWPVLVELTLIETQHKQERGPRQTAVSCGPKHRLSHRGPAGAQPAQRHC